MSKDDKDVKMEVGEEVINMKTVDIEQFLGDEAFRDRVINEIRNNAAGLRDFNDKLLRFFETNQEEAKKVEDNIVTMFKRDRMISEMIKCIILASREKDRDVAVEVKKEGGINVEEHTRELVNIKRNLMANVNDYLHIIHARYMIMKEFPIGVSKDLYKKNINSNLLDLISSEKNMNSDMCNIHFDKVRELFFRNGNYDEIGDILSLCDDRKNPPLLRRWGVPYTVFLVRYKASAKRANELEKKIAERNIGIEATKELNSMLATFDKMDLNSGSDIDIASGSNDSNMRASRSDINQILVRSDQNIDAYNSGSHINDMVKNLGMLSLEQGGADRDVKAEYIKNYEEEKKSEIYDKPGLAKKYFYRPHYDRQHDISQYEDKRGVPQKDEVSISKSKTVSSRAKDGERRGLAHKRGERPGLGSKRVDQKGRGMQF